MQSKTQRVHTRARAWPACTVAVSFRDSPNLAEIFRHSAQPVNLDEYITEGMLILNSLYSQYVKKLPEAVHTAQAWAIRGLGIFSQGILMGESGKAITVLARAYNLSSHRNEVQFLGRLQKMTKLVCNHL